MRTLLLILLTTATAYAEQRTWTIARDVYTAEGELVAVRGNLAYLKIAGKVEEVPLERLSAIDQAYIATLSLAPVMPGPADEVEQATAIMPEEMPLPGEPAGPELAPATSALIPTQPIPAGTYRVDENGRVIPLSSRAATNSRTANDGRRTSANSQRGDDDQRPGLFGARARRSERQRASAAARSR